MWKFILWDKSWKIASSSSSETGRWHSDDDVGWLVILTRVRGSIMVHAHYAGAMCSPLEIHSQHDEWCGPLFELHTTLTVLRLLLPENGNLRDKSLYFLSSLFRYKSTTLLRRVYQTVQIWNVECNYLQKYCIVHVNWEIVCLFVCFFVKRIQMFCDLCNCYQLIIIIKKNLK